MAENKRFTVSLITIIPNFKPLDPSLEKFNWRLIVVV